MTFSTILREFLNENVITVFIADSFVSCYFSSFLAFYLFIFVLYLGLLRSRMVVKPKNCFAYLII